MMAVFVEDDVVLYCQVDDAGQLSDHDHAVHLVERIGVGTTGEEVHTHLDRRGIHAGVGQEVVDMIDGPVGLDLDEGVVVQQGIVVAAGFDQVVPVLLSAD